MRFLKWILGTISFFALIALAIWLLFYIQFNKIKPEYPENVKLTGILKPVNIEIDSSGVPHVLAQNEQDLITAMGYYVASTHLWEMELMRRSGLGRLSEVFGQSTFDFDLMFRNIQLDSLSAYLYQNISEDSKKWLEWYTNGVNQFIINNKNNLPVEFQLMEHRPERWKPKDVLVVERFVGWMLNKSWKLDFFYWQVFNQLPSPLAREILPKDRIFPKNQSDKEYGIQQVKVFWEIDSKFRRWWGMLPTQDHAYGLAIRGRHSRFSKAILVNDEPLGSYLPFSWVEIHLSSPELNVAGFAVPGIPGVLVGRNDKMAWGAVHLFSQETEFNLETLALNQNRSPEDNVETEFSFHKETVLVRDKDRSYTFLVYRSSRKHIIIKPSLEDIHSRNMVSLNWTGSYPGDEILCLKLLATAGDWQSFRTAISYFNSPDLGFVFADQQGNIGANITGNFPMATTENKISTKKGQTDKDRGERFIPFEQLPALLNPGKNWVSTLDLQNDYTVNQFYKTVIPPETLLTKFQHDSSGVLMSENIEKNLTLSYSPENLQLLSSWLEIIQSRKYTGNTKQMGDIVWLLRDWKGGAQESGVASLVYKIWQWFVIKNVFADQMSVGLYDMFIDIPEVYMPIFYRIMTNSTDPWFDDSGTPNIKESPEEIVAKSFVETLQLLNDRLGEEIYRWQWKNFIISLNTRYDMPNNFYNFLSDNAPIQASANNIVTRLSGPGAQKLIVNEKKNQVAFVVDWNEDCCYRSINSTRFGLKLVSFPDYENAGPFSEKKFKTIFFDKDFKPLLYIYIEPR